MKIQLRKAALKDSNAISELCFQFGYETDVSQIKFRLTNILPNKDNCVFVAETDNNVIGWIHAFFSYRVESSPFVEIAGFVVDKKFRNLGIGKNLLSEVYDWTKSIGYTKVRVRCNTKRVETHIFYKKNDFIEVKEQKIFNKLLE